jgi:hypothetical protein
MQARRPVVAPVAVAQAPVPGSVTIAAAAAATPPPNDDDDDEQKLNDSNKDLLAVNKLWKCLN